MIKNIQAIPGSLRILGRVRGGGSNRRVHAQKEGRLRTSSNRLIPSALM
jgi:hypothetical protein